MIGIDIAQHFGFPNLLVLGRLKTVFNNVLHRRFNIRAQFRRKFFAPDGVQFLDQRPVNHHRIATHFTDIKWINSPGFINAVRCRKNFIGIGFKCFGR